VQCCTCFRYAPLAALQIVTQLNNYRYAFVKINHRLPGAGDEISVPKRDDPNRCTIQAIGKWTLLLHDWDKRNILIPEQRLALACIPMWPARTVTQQPRSSNSLDENTKRER